METKRLIHFKAPVRPPRIEFDLSVRAWYLRWSNARVAKTISEDRPGYIAALDLDAKNQIIGLELIGQREFSISWLKKASPIDLSEIDFDKARFVPAVCRESVVA
jgi:hypothetical protein